MVNLLYWEKLTIGGILLCLIGTALLIYVFLYKKKKKRTPYLISIPFLTIVWGMTSIIVFFTRDSNFMVSGSENFNLIMLCVRHFAINMVHWIFVMQYFRTSVILPKLFHGIMIDDFIEGGRFYKLN